MTQKEIDFPPSYRRKIMHQIAELLSGDRKGDLEAAREIVFDLILKVPRARNLPNEKLLKVFKQVAKTGKVTIERLSTKITELESAKRKADLRRSYPVQKRGSRKVKPWDWETTLRYLQNALDKNYTLCQRSRMKVKHYRAEEFLEGVKSLLGNKQHTSRDVVNMARTFNRRNMVATPVSVSNAIIDKLANRANFKRITFISTPTRR